MSGHFTTTKSLLYDETAVTNIHEIWLPIFRDVKSGLESTIDKNRLTCMLELLQPTKFYLSLETGQIFGALSKK